VSGPERILDLGVILAALVGIADQQRDRACPWCGPRIRRKNLDAVFFTPLRYMARNSRLAAVELSLDVVFGQRQPRRQPSTTQRSPGPCDSPNDVTQNSLPKVLPDMSQFLV